MRATVVFVRMVARMAASYIGRGFLHQPQPSKPSESILAS
jgi:hypothetical protein